MPDESLTNVEILIPGLEPDAEDDWTPPQGWHRLDISKDSKRRLLGPEYPGSAQLPATADELASQFGGAKAVDPPYDPFFLIFLSRQSSCLRQCFEAYVANICSPGARLEPCIDVDNPKAEPETLDREIADHLLAVATWPDKDTATEPTPAQVEAEKKRIGPDARLERIRLERWLQYCSPTGCFTALNERTRLELEMTGNAFWEVVYPDGGGWPELLFMPSHSVRLLPEDEEPIQITEQVKISPIEYGEQKPWRKFHRIVQVIGSRRAYFKAFGDPRVYSRKHGHLVSMDPNAEIEWDPGDGPAHEVIHWKVDAPNSIYGIPRWAGTWLNVIGLRESEEVTRNIFEHKSLPVAIYLASGGGRFPAEAVKKLADANKEMIQGVNNYHRSLFLHAEAPGPNADPSKMKLDVKFVPQPQDATFQGYDKRVFDKVAMAFRLPRILVGNSGDYNRATSDSAMAFAESQVFQPLRQAFDDWINRHLFTRMGIRYWKLVSNGPIPKDSEAVANLITSAAKTGAVTANELREVMSDVFNRDYARLEAPWADVPLAVLQYAPDLAQAPDAEDPDAAPGDAEAPTVPGAKPAHGGAAAEGDADADASDLADAEKEAAHLIKIRDSLLKAEAAAAGLVPRCECGE